MCSFFSKSEHLSSASVKETAKNVNERECSVQETVYHILCIMKLRRVLPVVHFINTNEEKTEEKTQVLLSKKELNELPDDSTLTSTLIDQMHYLVVENIMS